VASPAADRQRARSLEIIRQGESPEGGWGPFVNSPAEAFDTALVLMALRPQKQPTETAMIARGRKFLLATQNADGSWPATTRPRGVDSYAQQLSTTAWATQALLATR
jgi:Squalene-hopene cyclase C-terminal domain